MLSEVIKKTNRNRVLFIVFLNISSFFILFKINIFIANNTHFYELRIVKDIVGINLIIGAISIFSFFLYSYLYDDDYFHMFCLMYISIYFEFLVMTLMIMEVDVFYLMDVNKVFVGLASMFRTLIILLTFFENNIINKYLHENKIIAILLSMAITFGCICLDIWFMENNTLNSYINIIRIIKICVNTATFIALIGFCVQYVYKQNINYLITFLGTEVMFLSRILLTSSLYPSKSIMYILNRVILAIGFAIIVISMFWEIIIRTKENRKLVNQYNTQKMEMEKLRQEEELRTQFFANISHELRTPLNILNCSFQLLESKKNNKDILFEYYNKYEKTISENCSRMLRLINNIIDASKFESGCFKMNFMNCDIINIIEEVTLSIAQCEKAQKRKIIFDTDTEYLEIKCDPENIERVILNLLSNAIKFTSEDGNITVSCSKDDEYLTVKVRDDGIGIPEEFRKRIFERFVQVDKSFRRNVEGSGIGLSIVKFIVDSHGGEIYLNEEINNGCEFVVKLPNIRYNEEADAMSYIKSITEGIEAKVGIELSDI